MAETKYLDQTGPQHVLEGINTKFTKVGHKHTKADITDFAHTHDDRYYTETEIDTKLSGKSDTTHTHKYAGSATAGGSANSAVKLDTAAAGSATQPVYFADGKPVATTYTLGKSVPMQCSRIQTLTMQVRTLSALLLLPSTLLPLLPMATCILTVLRMAQ